MHTIQLRRKIILTGVISFSLVIAISIFYAILANKIKAISSSWSAYEEHQAALNYALKNISSHFGYDGLIHNYKDLILQGDQSRLPQVEQDFEKINRAIDNYQSLLSSDTEKQLLESVREILNQYVTSLIFVKKLLSENVSAVEIDKQVKIDDTQAINAINKLTELTLEQKKQINNTTTQSMEEATYMTQFGMLQVSFLVLFSVTLIIYLRKFSAANILTTLAAGQLDAVLEFAPDAMLTVNCKGKILRCNRATEKIFGWQVQEMTDMHMETLIPHRFRVAHVKMVEKFFSEQNRALDDLMQRELFALRKDGSEFPAEISLSCTTSTEGIAVLVHLRDITERFSHKKELIQAKQNAEQSNKAKSAFLATVSHELRTPLHAIISFSKLLNAKLPESIPKKLHQYVDRISESSDTLLRMVNQVLDVSQISSESLYLDVDIVDISDVVNDCVTGFKKELSRKNLILHLENKFSAKIRADKARLTQVLSHLISNAINYNIDGGTLTITVVRSAVKYDSVCISVIDTGNGIPEQHLNSIFEPFERLGKESSSIQGSGTGLFLVKHLTERMGGKIGVESVKGEGSRFWISFNSIEEV